MVPAASSCFELTALIIRKSQQPITSTRRLGRNAINCERARVLLSKLVEYRAQKNKRFISACIAELADVCPEAPDVHRELLGGTPEPTAADIAGAAFSVFSADPLRAIFDVRVKETAAISTAPSVLLPPSSRKCDRCDGQMQFSTSCPDPEYGGGWRCDKSCGSHGSPPDSPPRWFCRSCQSDICRSCHPFLVGNAAPDSLITIKNAGCCDANGVYVMTEDSGPGNRPVYTHNELPHFKIQWSSMSNVW